jgi:adenylate cyclase
MDVTTVFVPTIPDESEDRRVRTSLSEVNKMAYGIADTLGKTDHVTMFDLVQPEFRDKKNEAIFAMFGRSEPMASNNRLSKFLHEQFISVLSKQVDQIDASKGENISDALRRTFLRLNKLTYDFLSSSAYLNRKTSHASVSTTHVSSFPEKASGRSGASGVVVYVVDKTLYVANAGNALAVVSRQGQAYLLSVKHDPFERTETVRIRAAEGWISPKGFVNDEIDVSRSFGFFHLLPVVNASPDISVWDMTELDEFVIIGNRGLWDFVSIQTAVDIARSERADPMIAAQKLRDFAISYGADGSTMIMVLKVSDLFNVGPRERLPTLESLVDSDAFLANRRRKPDPIGIRDVSRLPEEIDAPRGHIALVFTDIKNSTHLWDSNPGMPTAMIFHNILLRRQLRFRSGYEVKTEGDSFMCSFPTVLHALWWCLSVQLGLLNIDWPTEILDSEDGREIRDESGRLVARGLSVRMGIHWGNPVCEPDPVTGRMDYFGSMVNRASRISSSAAGGQIMCSADVVREINAKIFDIEESETEFSYLQPPDAIEAIRTLGVVVQPVGEVKLKGLEVPAMLSVVYPRDLAGRSNIEQLEAMASNPSSTVQFTVDQVRALALLCLRFEALTDSRIFHASPERKDSISNEVAEGTQEHNSRLHFSCNPKLLLPTLDKASDGELLIALRTLTVRLENAIKSLVLQHLTKRGIFRDVNGTSRALTSAVLDERTLDKILAVLDQFS